jgi:PAS domain S-box-containing protein
MSLGAENPGMSEREFLSAVFSASGVLVVVLDTEGRIVIFNKTCERVTGRTFAEVKGRHFWDFFLVPEEIDPVMHVFGELCAGQFPNEHENYWITKTGERRPIMWSNTALLGKNGQVAFVIGTGIDVTERRKAEDALQASEARWVSITENTPDHIMVVDAGGCILTINHTAPGLTVEEVIGTSLYDYLPSTSAVKAKECLERVLATGDPGEYEAEYREKNGSLHHYETRVALMKTPGQKPVFTLSSREITDRIRAHEAQRESEERFRLSFESANVGVCLVNLDGRFIKVNERMCEFVGYSRHELQSMTVNEIGHPDDASTFSEVKRQALSKEGKYGTFEKRYYHKTGRLLWGQLSTCLARDSQGNPLYLIGHVQDITGRKQAEEELQKHQQHLEELVEERTSELVRTNQSLEKEIKVRRNVEMDLRDALLELARLKDRLEAENLYLQDEIKRTHGFEEIVGESAVLLKVLQKVQQVAATDASVLITGETGTGKELVARAIHNRSSRGGRPLVAINCSSLPSSLIENELFGHEKGAFTGALAKKIGRFELADGGTIFLDEIGDLAPDIQINLLRVLQEGEFERVGSTKTIRVDVRIIAATNRNLRDEIAAERFRSDLFYRLNVFPIFVPPLRERLEDIPLLVSHIICNKKEKIGKTIEEVPGEVIEALMAYDWPGNVRELENVIAHSAILSPGSRLQLCELFGPDHEARRPHGHGAAAPVHVHKQARSIERTSAVPGAEIPSRPDDPASSRKPQTLKALERAHILSVLESCGWKISGKGNAAEILGLNASTLRSRMRKLGVERPRE